MRKIGWVILFLALIVSACSRAEKESVMREENQPGGAATLPDLGAAPELDNKVWLNTTGPLRLADLRGKVVLLDMWTFG